MEAKNGHRQLGTYCKLTTPIWAVFRFDMCRQGYGCASTEKDFRPKRVCQAEKGLPGRKGPAKPEGKRRLQEGVAV